MKTDVVSYDVFLVDEFLFRGLTDDISVHSWISRIVVAIGMLRFEIRPSQKTFLFKIS